MKSPYDEQDFDNTKDLIDKRRRYARRPKQAANLLGQLMARKGYNQIEAQDELADVWFEIAGETMKTKTRVGTVRYGILEIQVASSAARQQLEFQKRQLIKQLQARLPKNKIKDLRFKVTKF